MCPKLDTDYYCPCNDCLESILVTRSQEAWYKVRKIAVQPCLVRRGNTETVPFVFDVDMHMAAIA